MTLSIELLPAPLGPMIARISCSRTSKLMSVSALTPPKASEMRSSLRMGSPIRCLRLIASRRLPAGGRIRLRLGDPEVGGDHAGAAVLEADQRLDVLHRPATVQRVD